MHNFGKVEFSWIENVLLSYSDESKETKRTSKTNSAQVIEPVEEKPWKHVDHIVMNLPASALDFLGKSIPRKYRENNLNSVIYSIYTCQKFTNYAYLCAKFPIYAWVKVELPINGYFKSRYIIIASKIIWAN